MDEHGGPLLEEHIMHQEIQNQDIILIKSRSNPQADDSDESEDEYIDAYFEENFVENL